MEDIDWVLALLLTNHTTSISMAYDRTAKLSFGGIVNSYASPFDSSTSLF
jgi:hypothetical protein